VAVQEHRLFALDEHVRLSPDGGTIALDGEREIEVYGRHEVSVCVTRNGPRVVDICRCISEAASLGVFCG
jgi:hypothetical protein